MWSLNRAMRPLGGAKMGPNNSALQRLTRPDGSVSPDAVEDPNNEAGVKCLISRPPQDSKFVDLQRYMSHLPPPDLSRSVLTASTARHAHLFWLPPHL